MDFLDIVSTEGETLSPVKFVLLSAFVHVIVTYLCLSVSYPWLWCCGVVAFFVAGALLLKLRFPFDMQVFPGQIAAIAFLSSSVFCGLCFFLWMVVARAFQLLGIYLWADSWIHSSLVQALLASFFATAVASVAYAAYVEPAWLAVRRIPLGDPAKGPATKVAIVTDLHCEGPLDHWDNVVAAVNAEKPDVLLCLGDCLGSKRGLKTFQDTLARMECPHKYAVKGNWDVWYWRKLPLLESTGFSWLGQGTVPDIVTVAPPRAGAPGLTVAGCPWMDGSLDSAAHPKGPGACAEGINAVLARSRRERAGDWKVALYHSPDLADMVTAADLYLAGHTHGGQLAMPLYGAFVVISRFGKRFERGLRTALNGRTQVYVSPGLGVEPAIPLRFCVRPEVTVLELHPRAGAAD